MAPEYVHICNTYVDIELFDRNWDISLQLIACILPVPPEGELQPYSVIIGANTMAKLHLEDSRRGKKPGREVKSPDRGSLEIK